MYEEFEVIDDAKEAQAIADRLRDFLNSAVEKFNSPGRFNSYRLAMDDIDEVFIEESINLGNVDRPYESEFADKIRYLEISIEEFQETEFSSFSDMLVGLKNLANDADNLSEYCDRVF